MKYKCPTCPTIYDELPHDESCKNIYCIGEKLLPFSEEGEVTIEGLCLLVCDASFSMTGQAFSKQRAITKLKLVTRAINRAIADLRSISKADSAFIGIIVFGGKAGFILNGQGRPMLMPFSQFQTQFGSNLDDYLYQCIEENRPDIDREHTDITGALQFAYDVYKGAMSGNLGQFGIEQTVSLIEHTDIYTYDKRQVSVANARVMIYSDGEHNPHRRSMRQPLH